GRLNDFRRPFMMECKLFMFHDIYRLDLPESKYIKSGLGRDVKMKMKQSVCREFPLLLEFKTV
ncbi:hypothetical protein, partial [Neisseria sp. HMSC070A01]|uniref:hypothetical protein n=1 Tax=Neisseria sp. HMSC070A01 TaxID=1715190 RepID=UPI001AEF43D4